MATEKPRISVTLEEDVLRKVEEFRHNSRISTTSKAAAALIQFALDVLENEEKEGKPFNPGQEIEDMIEALMELKNEIEKEK